MLEQYTVLRHITKGFSNDQKFVVQDGDEKCLYGCLKEPRAAGAGI